MNFIVYLWIFNDDDNDASLFIDVDIKSEFLYVLWSSEWSLGELCVWEIIVS